MPKMTAKYAWAVNTAHNHNLPVRNTHNQEELYQLLQESGFFWDSGIKRWEYHEPAAADDPTPLIMVRVWADGEIIEEAADDLVRQASALNWRLVERSQVYGCRPPKQREGRVYLRFLPGVRDA